MSEYTDLAAYYAKCGGACEQVYAKPERQEDLADLQEQVAQILDGHRVLELACGTGYWTEHIADTAESVFATDINPALLDLAKARGLPADKVKFAVTDAFDPASDPEVSGNFTAVFAGSWWSHVKRADQAGFIAKLRERVGKDALLVMVDEAYVEGTSTPVARTDADGNTYQILTAPDGERYDIVRNFPTDSALRKKLGTALKELRISRLEHYWMLTGRLK
jgi:SAM-dependent methyltransferase